MSHAARRPPALPSPFVARPATDPLATACADASSGGDPATVFHAPLADRCEFAITLQPDRPLSTLPVLRLAALALHDALAALAPIRVPLAIDPGFEILVNGATVGRVTLHHAAADIHAPLDWAVVAVCVDVDLRAPAPGERPDETCLVEEGFVSDELATELLEAFCRNLAAWFHAWTEDGEHALAASWRVATAAYAGSFAGAVPA